MRDDGHKDRNEETMGRSSTSAGARYGSLEPTSKAFDRLMQEHKKERVFCFNVCSTGSAVFFRSVG